MICLNHIFIIRFYDDKNTFYSQDYNKINYLLCYNDKADI